jgi:tetratricopeptide (TPR) repeat protein
LHKKGTKYGFLILMLAAFLLVSSSATGQVQPPVVMQKRQQDPLKAKEKLGLSYYQQKKFDKAAAIYKELYETSPRHYYYTYYLNCLIYLKELKQADKLVKKQVRSHPSNFRYHVDQIYVTDLMGNKKKANKMMDALISDLPDNRSLVIQIAASLESKGYFQEALTVYESAQQKQDEHVTFHLEKARIYRYTGDYDLMFDAYLQHLELRPQDVQIIKNRLQGMMRQDVDDNLSTILKQLLLEKAQGDPNNFVYAEMLLWHAMQTKDFDMAYRQARAIDMRFENREEDMLEVAEITYSNRLYELSSKAYGYLKDKGEASPFYLDAYNGYYLALCGIAEYNPETTDQEYKRLVKTGEKALEEMGLFKGTIPIALQLAHLMAFELNDYDKSRLLLEEALEVGNLDRFEKSKLKLELADILLFEDQVWDATLLFSQIEADMKNEPLGHEAKFRNARLFYYVGEYDWAQAKLDILKSATSKLIANDAMELSLFIKDIYDEDTLGFQLKKFGTADLLVYQGKYDSAMYWLEKVDNDNPGVNTYQHLIYKKAKMMEIYHEYQTADSLYNYLATSFPDSFKADNALFRRAEIQRQYLDNVETAQELYLKLMREYPDSIYAGEARKIYRSTRKETNPNDPIPLNEVP